MQKFNLNLRPGRLPTPNSRKHSVMYHPPLSKETNFLHVEFCCVNLVGVAISIVLLTKRNYLCSQTLYIRSLILTKARNRRTVDFWNSCLATSWCYINRRYRWRWLIINDFYNVKYLNILFKERSIDVCLLIYLTI